MTNGKDKKNSEKLASSLKTMATISAVIVAIVASYYSAQGEIRRLQREVEELRANFTGVAQGEIRVLQREVADLKLSSARIDQKIDAHCDIGPNGLPHAQSFGVILKQLEGRVVALEKE